MSGNNGNKAWVYRTFFLIISILVILVVTDGINQVPTDFSINANLKDTENFVIHIDTLTAERKNNRMVHEKKKVLPLRNGFPRLI